MGNRIEPLGDLGLQQVLENGLAVLEEGPIDQARKAQILDSLILIFAEARHGSQAIGNHNLLFAVEEAPAFERFTLFFHYLKDVFHADLSARLAEATSVLTDLRQGAQRGNDQKIRTSELIQRLLDALKQESALTPLLPPRDLRFG